MKNKTVIITGANSGIGKEAALKFAKENYTVIMACRNMDISRRVHEQITKESNNEVELMELDVSSFESIRKFCSDFQNRYEQLDILIHNAGYFNHGEPYRESADGIELTFATNVMGPFLMTHLLLGQLRKSEDPRILFAGSNIIKHFFDPKRKIDFLDCRHEQIIKSFTVYKMYAQSKMALTLLTFKMAEKFEPFGIKVNALQINGARMSKETIKKFKPKYKLVAWVQNLFIPPASYMADKYFKICTAEQFKHTTGKLFNDKPEVMQPSPKEYPGFIKQMKQILGTRVYPAYPENTNVSDKLWAICAELTGNPIIADEKQQADPKIV
ncbi:SDR family oxidoreductase [Paenibacillus lautus]|uniref:SDR family oxidoreductase n=1 Tax=Paenibacillus lautus TaxID=1401 RepID=A0A385TUK1_PAELA|nr:SDR family oxidoreductase [Paenibacillus lautus]AYB46162.1 SDR family oxidoreductase [Paenibacillus lautus]VTR27539.1 short-chain dehydrogenase/reductase SDR [Actinobacillus pleuropneumoniae]